MSLITQMLCALEILGVAPLFTIYPLGITLGPTISAIQMLKLSSLNFEDRGANIDRYHILSYGDTSNPYTISF